MEHNAFAGAQLHREMSLGSHGYDREVDRAQHLFCHGTEEQLAELAPAPGTEKEAISLELANSGCNLLYGGPLAHQRIAGDVLLAGQLAPGLQGPGDKVQCAGRIVVWHSGGIGRHGCGWGKHMQENQPRLFLRSLFKGKRHQAVQVAQIGGDEEDGRVSPTVKARMRV
jgi:hypothetical protein